MRTYLFQVLGLLCCSIWFTAAERIFTYYRNKTRRKKGITLIYIAKSIKKVPVSKNYGMGWNGIESKFSVGRLQSWKGMEDIVDGMESGLPSFHPNPIINFLTALISRPNYCMFFFSSFSVKIYELFCCYSYQRDLCLFVFCRNSRLRFILIFVLFLTRSW